MSDSILRKSRKKKEENVVMEQSLECGEKKVCFHSAKEQENDRDSGSCLNAEDEISKKEKSTVIYL